MKERYLGMTWVASSMSIRNEKNEVTTREIKEILKAL